MIHYFINTLKCLIDNIYMQILNDTDYQPSLEEKRVTTLNRRLDETGSDVVREGAVLFVRASHTAIRYM